MNLASSQSPSLSPTPRLLAFYDRLRERVAAAVEERGGRLGTPAAGALLLVPDVFILLVRLGLDRDVPKESRRLLLGALAYFLLPIDLLPEIALGPWGFLDDLVLASIVLAEALGPDLEAVAAQHWSGSGELRRNLAQIVGSARSLLGDGLYERLRRLLARRGITL